MSIEFKLAQTDEEKEAIFRFRYQIYIEEMNRPAHADHEKRQITDSFDKTAHIFYVERNQELVATARTNFQRESPIEFEKEYLLEQFGDYYPDRISTTSKLMVSNSNRNGRLTPYIINQLYKYTIRNKIAIDFINCNEPLDSLYEKMGYRRYRDNIAHKEFGSVVPMVLFLYDIEHLRKINSPFFKVAEELKIEPDSSFESIKNKLNPYNIRLSIK
jgi:predicted GNAT family N-acyltransferase